ncbi:MAG: hypothetical protein JWM30_3899, partial [Burkholderia sp.]|nr:hypothetical protein [Burkholderia sp.]
MSDAGIDIAGLRRIVVFRALQLGDLLCAVPALRALRRAAPQAHITLVGLPWASSFVTRYSMLVDDLMVFPGYPGMPEVEPEPEALPRFLESARARAFDLAIQLHGSGVLTNPLTLALGARRNAGLYAAGQPCPDADTFIQWIPEEHEVLRYLRLMSHLGVASDGEHLAFPLLPDDHAECARIAPGLEPGTYVCVHPGARMPSRRWPPQRFAEVADGLAV